MASSQELFSKLLGQAGTAHAFPLLTRGHNHNARGGDPKFPLWYQDLSNWFWYHEDFLWDAFDADEHSLALYDASAAGTPVQGLVADGVGGQFQIQLAATSEAETAGIHQGGNLYIDSAKPFIFAARVQVVHTMAANQVVVIGLGSDIDTSTLDNITRNVWFRLDADFDLLTELDDNTTDTDDQDTNFDIVEDTWYTFVIVKGYDGIVNYALLTANGTSMRVLDTISGAALTGKLQPLLLAQKASGTTQPEILVDWFGYGAPRAV